MGFYGPKKTHIKRIFGQQRKDDGTTEEVREVFADVERTDSLPTVEWPGAQENQINLLWRDAPGESGNPKRQMQIVRLTDPEDESDDPDTFIEIPTISRMTMIRHPGAQEIVTTFQPSAADPVAEDRVTAREVAVRRIPFCETNVDDVLDATGYLADGEDYERKLDTIDDTQHLDVEIVESYPSKIYNGPSPQDVKVSLGNDAFKDAYAKPPNGARRPPLRLDPFQNIRNVSWGAGATEFPPASTLWRDLSLADSPKLSISMFVRTTASNEDDPIMQPILQFGGDENEALNFLTGGYFICAGTGVLECYVSSKRVFNIVDYLSINKATGAPLSPTIIGGSPLARLMIGVTSFNWDDKKWNHIGLAIDASSPVEHIVGHWPPNYAAPGSGTRWTSDVAFVVNRKLEAASPSFLTVSDAQLPDDEIDRFSDWPAFDLNFAGQLGLPVNDVNAFGGAPVLAPGSPFPRNNFTQIEYSAVQIWHNQFIDFRDPDVLSKFALPATDIPSDASADGIRLVDPSVAQQAFGKPTFFFDGPPSRFVNNRGAGGEFTKIGDLKSFRPAPPRATSS